MLHGAAPRHLGGPSDTSDGAFLPAKILSKTINFERPGGREWLPSGTPFQLFYIFLEAFSDPRVYRYHKETRLGEVFLQRRKSVHSYGYQDTHKSTT